MREGKNAYFEVELTPVDDPKLKVEWYWNGKPLEVFDVSAPSVTSVSFFWKFL